MHYFKLKTNRMRLAAGLHPDPLGGAYSALPDSQLDLRGGKGVGRERVREGREGDGRKEGEG